MITTIKVCVASPGDVKEEREQAFEVITSLNRALTNQNSPVRIEAFGWEQVSPGMHIAGPQGRIDDQLPWKDADYVVAIFWRRFGSQIVGEKTPTEHEVDQAYVQWQTTTRPQLRLYFAEKPYYPESTEDADQFRAVIEFRHRFHKRGLVRAFAKTASFATDFYSDLVELILEKSRTTRQEDGRDGSPRVQVAQFFVDADQPLIISEGTAEPVGDIRIQLADPTVAQTLAIEVALNAPVLDERAVRRGLKESAEAILPDGRRIAGTYTSSHTIRFDGLDGGIVGRGSIVIRGIRVACAVLGIPAAGNTIEVKATLRLLPDLAAKVTYFSGTPEVVVAKARFSMTSETVGVTADSFTPGRPTLLKRFAPLPLRQRLRTQREDLFVIGAVRICERGGGLFRTRLAGEESGTRFIVRISGMPQGVEVFTSATDVDITGSGSTASIVLLGQVSLLQSSDDALDSSFTTRASALRVVGFRPVSDGGGREVEAVYEFVGQRSTEGGDGHRFDVVVAIRGQPTELGACTATVRLGPENRYSGHEPSVPRYVDTSGRPQELLSILREPLDHWIGFILKSIESESIDWRALSNQWTREVCWHYEGTEWQHTFGDVGNAIQAKDIGWIREAIERLLSDPPPY